MQVRTLIQREMNAALSKYDALLCPAAPTPAYRLGEKSADPLAMYKGEMMRVRCLQALVRTVSANSGLLAPQPSAAGISAAFSGPSAHATPDRATLHAAF